MIVVVDNYDSFTYNLVQFLGELGAEPVVYRNDATTPEEIAAKDPRGIVISPGPGTPKEAGISVPIVRELSGTVPILGVCLGHQSIGEAFGARIGRTAPLHGKASLVRHDESPLYRGVANPFSAGRYHSLVIERRGIPDDLVVTASTGDRPDSGIIMGVRHRDHPTYGVQFHPESILTQFGKVLLKNFLESCGEAR